MEGHELTRTVWDVDAADYPADGGIEERARFLLGYAVLAPSSHNSQPWRFAIRENRVGVGVDHSRALPVADPDGRERYLSVGCALENLCVAAEHFDVDPQVAYRPDDDPFDDVDDVETVAVVALHPNGHASSARPAGTFAALTERYTSHAAFEDRPVEAAALEHVESVAAEPNVTVSLIEDPERKRAVGRLQAEADRRLMADPDYRRELGHWIGVGALGDSWLAARVGQLVVNRFDLGDREAEKNSLLIEGTPTLGVLASPDDDPATRVRVGQVFERVALVASAHGVAVHPVSQTLERPNSRDRLAEVLDLDGRPQHLFRLGYADEPVSHTPRWPVEAVLEE